MFCFIEIIMNFTDHCIAMDMLSLLYPCSYTQHARVAMVDNIVPKQEKVFIKSYAPTIMPDPKRQWSVLKQY